MQQDQEMIAVSLTRSGNGEVVTKNFSLQEIRDRLLAHISYAGIRATMYKGSTDPASYHGFGVEPQHFQSHYGESGGRKTELHECLLDIRSDSGSFKKPSPEIEIRIAPAWVAIGIAGGTYWFFAKYDPRKERYTYSRLPIGMRADKSGTLFWMDAVCPANKEPWPLPAFDPDAWEGVGMLYLLALKGQSNNSPLIALTLSKDGLVRHAANETLERVNEVLATLIARSLHA